MLKNEAKRDPSSSSGNKLLYDIMDRYINGGKYVLNFGKYFMLGWPAYLETNNYIFGKLFRSSS